jgi:hypothetical protein
MMADIAVRTLDHDRIADELERRADYAGWADRLAGAVSAHRPPAMSGAAQSGPDTAPATHRPRTGQLPDTAGGQWPDTRTAWPDRRPGSPRRTRRTSRPDTHRAGGGRARAASNGQVTAQQIAQAMARTPRPTQVQVARELGVSERTVRRALRGQHGHGS